jgi:hypothetical protein
MDTYSNDTGLDTVFLKETSNVFFHKRYGEQENWKHISGEVFIVLSASFLDYMIFSRDLCLIDLWKRNKPQGQIHYLVIWVN